jgi:DNA-binding transcriptional MerR regulator
LYETEGVLIPAAIDPANGYRRYDEAQLRDARVIRMLRRIDMPIRVVASVLHADRRDRARIVRRYWADVEARTSRQRSIAHHLIQNLSEGEETHPMFEIRTRDVDAQHVVTEQAHLTAEMLDDWIERTLTRERTALEPVGGPSGPPAIIFHGEVNEDSDGPVEAVTPFAPGGEVDVATRVDPARREAFVTVTKRQLVFPDVLVAYDAVEAWIAQHARQVGSPREIYFTDVAAAADDDLVCEIAFPIVDR